MTGRLTCEKKILVSCLGNYTLVNQSIKNLMTDAARGGNQTKQYFEAIQNKQKKLAALVKDINSKGENAWNQDDVEQNNIKRYASYSGATCNIVSYDFDSGTRNELAESISVKGAKFDKCIYIIFDSGDGLTLVQQFAVLGIGSFIGLQVSNIISGLVRQMSLALTRTLITLEETSVGIEAIGTTFEEALEGVIAEEGILVEIELTTAIGEGIVTVGAALAEFLLPIIITFGTIYLIEKYILKGYTLHLDIINITEKDINLDISYLYNIDRSKGIFPSSMLLRKVRFGDKINLPGVGNVTTNNILVSKATCLLVSDSTFLKGMGILIKETPVANAEFKNILGLISISRFSDNFIDCWYNESSNNYENLFNERSGKYQSHKITSTCSYYTSIITISELSGADNNIYFSNLFVVNNNDFKDYTSLL